METFEINHQITIAVHPRQVFDAISQPEHLVNWWPLSCEGQPSLGQTYRFYFGPEYDWAGFVTVATPNSRFEIEMKTCDRDWVGTVFGFELLEKSGKSIVSFYHKGWKELNDHFKISSFCWAMLLKGLKDYLEAGVIIPFEKRS